jgi:hypothetical protein
MVLGSMNRDVDIYADVHFGTEAES